MSKASLLVRTLLPLLVTLAGCAWTTHRAQPSALGVARSSDALLALLETPGPVVVETVNSADWAVPRAGLINLGAAAAKRAQLTDGDEAIQVYFHVIRHPSRGTFLIDTGVERALRDAPHRSAMRGLVATAMHTEKLKVRMPLADWLESEPAPIAGVFFTHLHFDHVTGAPDLPKSTPLYAGPGETTARAAINALVQGTMNRALDGLPAIAEWPFTQDAAGRFAGVVDVFGDGSFWALWTPGHTPGSTAYLARTADGPVLFTGDTSHTVWGWEHDVEPGDFTADHPQNAESLAQLRRLVREHPSIAVRLGHQARPTTSAAR